MKRRISQLPAGTPAGGQVPIVQGGRTVMAPVGDAAARDVGTSVGELVEVTTSGQIDSSVLPAIAGTPGPMGDPGPAGQDGMDGATGPQGPIGDPGPAGQDGDDGATGPEGQQGQQGPRGEAGNDGAQGSQGDRGFTGEQGPQGVPGQDGNDGADGNDGQTGPQGPQGETGPRGPQGEQGIQGDQGEQGPPGTGSGGGATNFNQLEGQAQRAQIADDAIDGSKIAPGAVGSSEIANGSIQSAELAANAVTVASIANSAVTTAKVDNNAITADKIADQAVGVPKLGNDAATRLVAEGGSAGQFLARTGTTGQVWVPRPAEGATTFIQLSGTASSAQIANDAITTEKVADGAITFPKLETPVSNRLVATGGTTGQFLARAASGLTEWLDGSGDGGGGGGTGTGFIRTNLLDADVALPDSVTANGTLVDLNQNWANFDELVLGFTPLVGGGESLSSGVVVDILSALPISTATTGSDLRTLPNHLYAVYGRAEAIGALSVGLGRHTNPAQLVLGTVGGAATRGGYRLTSVYGINYGSGSGETAGNRAGDGTLVKRDILSVIPSVPFTAQAQTASTTIQLLQASTTDARAELSLIITATTPGTGTGNYVIARQQGALLFLEAAPDAPETQDISNQLVGQIANIRIGTEHAQVQTDGSFLWTFRLGSNTAGTFTTPELVFEGTIACPLTQTVSGDDWRVRLEGPIDFPFSDGDDIGVPIPFDVPIVRGEQKGVRFRITPYDLNTDRRRQTPRYQYPIFGDDQLWNDLVSGDSLDSDGKLPDNPRYGLYIPLDGVPHIGGGDIYTTGVDKIQLMTADGDINVIDRFVPVRARAVTGFTIAEIRGVEAN